MFVCDKNFNDVTTKLPLTKADTSEEDAEKVRR